MTVTDDRPQVELPEPLPCPHWCTADHAEGTAVDFGVAQRLHVHHLDFAAGAPGAGFDVAVWRFDAFLVGVDTAWGRAKHNRPYLTVSNSGFRIKLWSRSEVARFLGLGPCMYPQLVERVREAAALLGWVVL